MPVEVGCAIFPLPGIGVCGPRHVNSVQLVIALVSKPGALPVGEVVTCTLDRSGWWRRGPRRFGNTNSLMDIDHVGIRDVVVGSQPLQVDVVMGGYSPQGIAASNHMDAIPAGARGFRECPK